MTNYDKLNMIFGSETISELPNKSKEEIDEWLHSQYEQIGGSLEFQLDREYFFDSKDEAIKISQKAKNEGYKVKYVSKLVPVEGEEYKAKEQFGFVLVDPFVN